MLDEVVVSNRSGIALVRGGGRWCIIVAVVIIMADLAKGHHAAVIGICWWRRRLKYNVTVEDAHAGLAVGSD